MGEESDLTTGLCYNRFPDEKGTESSALESMTQ